MKKLIILVGMTLSMGLAFADHHDEPGEPDLREITQKLSTLENRIQNIEKDIDDGMVGWSCAAYCGGFYGSQLRRVSVSSNGVILKNAWEELQSQCENNHLFIGITPQRTLHFASIRNACERNDGIDQP